MSTRLYQQVNLYQPIFRRQQRVFSAVSMVQSVAVIAVALLTVYGYGFWQLQDLQTEADLLANRESAYSLQLAGLGTSSGFMQRETLERSLRSLAASLESRQELIDAIDKVSLGNADGFSATLSALGRQRESRLWLTGVQINGSTNSIVLSGRSTSPGLVPDYLLSLGDEEALAGQRFEQMRMQRSDESGEIEFQVLGEAVQP